MKIIKKRDLSLIKPKGELAWAAKDQAEIIVFRLQSKDFEGIPAAES